MTDGADARNDGSEDVTDAEGDTEDTTEDEEDEPDTAMGVPRAIQRWVDEIVRDVHDEEVENAGKAYDKLCKWIEEDWDRVGEASGESRIMVDLSGFAGSIAHDDVRDSLDLEEDEELTLDARRQYLAEWLEARLEDADDSIAVAGMDLLGSDGRSAVLGYSTNGYSFSGVSIAFFGVHRDREALFASVFSDDMVEGPDEMLELSSDRVMELFE